jgi:hypothetical protein
MTERFDHEINKKTLHEREKTNDLQCDCVTQSILLKGDCYREDLSISSLLFVIPCAFVL